jgi:hypothetical protein
VKRLCACAAVGFIVACFWVLLSFLAPPDLLRNALREPAVQVAFITCPVLYLRYLPLQFWWIPLINAASYAITYLPFELMRRKSHSGLIITSER